MKVKYDCIDGYEIADENTYKIGEKLGEIGEVQSIIYPCPRCKHIECLCEADEATITVIDTSTF
jgi:phage FluMu protein Com